MMEEKVHGSAGERVLMEDFLEGEEASLLCFCDGASLVPMASAQDHKRVGEGDTGPNTGGMGAYSPAPVLDAAAMDRVRSEVLEPTLRGLKAEGMNYRGCLYVGLMIGPSGPRVVEYNCRFGDPETQAVVPRMDFDLAQVMLACAQGEGLAALGELKWRPEAVACVVLASAGYPGKAGMGKPIHGLDSGGKALIFHAGTRLEQGQLLSAGGRVLGVVGLGQGLRAAVNAAYAGVEKIHFDGMQYRRDIGQRALNRDPQGA
jgi:phosphoribosylamine--glycine ligase